MTLAKTHQEGTVSALYSRLREMAASFAFKPGERINESALSSKLGASRTPLREALNRLVAEGFVEFQSGKGFFCRTLSDRRISQLYEARMAIECETTRHVARRASKEALDALESMLDSTAEEYRASKDPIRLMELDETFHLSLAALAQNTELLDMLRTTYDKIRFVRTADLRQMRAQGDTTVEGHRAILAAVRLGDPEAASDEMRAHIERRLNHAASAVRLAYADLYAPQDDVA